MNTTYKKWLPYIERDLRVAQKLYRDALQDKSTNWYDWMFIIWNCHQVAEKSLKMIIIAKDIELPYIHDLGRLYEIADIEFAMEWKKILGSLGQYHITPKYPDLPLKKSYPKANQMLAKKYLNFAATLFLWTKKYISQKKQ